jgi:hypothetical protein
MFLIILGKINIARFSNFVNTLLDVHQQGREGAPVIQETAFLMRFC